MDLTGGKMKTIGTRVEVYRGKAKKTSGGMTKKDIIKRKGRYISKKASTRAKKMMKKGGVFSEYIKLAKANKGKEFKPLHKSMLTKKTSRKTHSKTSKKSK